MADQPISNQTQQAASSQKAPGVDPAVVKIHVTVRNRTMILFSDDVKSVTSRNDSGLFDVLPEHSNFISLITSPLIIGKMDGSKKELTFSNGIIKVKDNAVYCYIDLLSAKPAAATQHIIPTGAKPIK
jgi:ATP synthase delta/epsilon subunit-like protein